MYRFFVEPDGIDRENGKVHIRGNDVNHIRNALRMRPGEEISVSDGSGREYLCRLEEIAETAVSAAILAEETGKRELSSRIVLFQGLPKSDKMEWIVQKAVELGAFEIAPVAMERCVVRLDGKKAKARRARWQSIAESAAKQSGRLIIPEVLPPMTWEEALERASGLDVFLLPYERAEGMETTRECLGAIRPGQSVGVMIGPEGGFAPEEVREAARRGAQAITLGRRILRTETAGLSVLSVLAYLLEP